MFMIHDIFDIYNMDFQWKFSALFGRKHKGAEKARKILKPILALLLLFNIKRTSVFSIKPLFRWSFILTSNFLIQGEQHKNWGIFPKGGGVGAGGVAFKCQLR